jgi:hypothetical protein
MLNTENADKVSFYEQGCIADLTGSYQPFDVATSASCCLSAERASASCCFFTCVRPDNTALMIKHTVAFLKPSHLEQQSTLGNVRG